MNLKTIILLLVLLVPTGYAATISGTAFEWYTLEPLDNVIVEIDTAPRQLVVAENGFYSFNVPQGNYELNAFYFDANRLVYVSSESLSIQNDGNFTLDLLMLPSVENDILLEDLEDITIPETPGEIPAEDNTLQIAGGILLFIAALVLVVYGARKITTSATGLETERIGIEEKYFERAKELAGKREKPAEKTDRNLEEVLSILKRYGGRMTQKELREKVTFGEAKTSLIVAELEETGRVKKFKKGRGNIIVLK